LKFSPGWNIISKGFANKEFSEISTQNNQKLIGSDDLSNGDSQSKDDNVISELVSKLFNHVESKESFDFISDLLLTSLSIYKKKLSVESHSLNQEKNLNLNDRIKINFCEQILSNTKTEYLSISNDIHSILTSCPELSSNQKLDYCNSQRYFMKLYMKEIVVKLKNQWLKLILTNECSFFKQIDIS